jgi:hypothetical protein
MVMINKNGVLHGFILFYEKKLERYRQINNGGSGNKNHNKDCLLNLIDLNIVYGKRITEIKIAVFIYIWSELANIKILPKTIPTLNTNPIS